MAQTIHCATDGPADLLGMVKIQMPEQCEPGASFRIRQAERVRNQEILQHVVAVFGSWARDVNAPAIILFPELSVTEESADFLFRALTTDDIAPNTLIVFGMEQLTARQYLARVADSDSRGLFTPASFRRNIDRVNTAVILAKDRDGEVTRFYQPKCTLSDYESRNQFTSDLVYDFTFGTHHLIVSVCSDFLLHDRAGPVMGSIMQDMDRLYERPEERRLDLVLLIQKNPSPIGSLYGDSVRYLHFNSPHHIQTVDTIVCAVNSAHPGSLDRFGESNLSVMRRGRAPFEFRNRCPYREFAWRPLGMDGSAKADNLHVVRWRLRGAGAISFVLNTDSRPYRLVRGEPVPVAGVGISRLTAENEFEAITPIPEVYELGTVLHRDFPDFVGQVLASPVLRPELSRVPDYEMMLDKLFDSTPQALLDLLLALHKCFKNCDHWDLAALADVFRYFVVALRLIQVARPDLTYRDDVLRGGAHSFGILDCQDLSASTLLRRSHLPIERLQQIDIVILQRLSEPFPWDGRITTLDALSRQFRHNAAPPEQPARRSVAAAPSPYIADLSSLIDDICSCCAAPEDVGSVINDHFQPA